MRRARLLAVVLAGAGILPAAIPAAAAGHLVRITATLEPAALTVAPGDRVTWRNDDDERHRIRSTSGPAQFDSGNLEPGESFSVTLAATGRYDYLDDRDRDLTQYHGAITVRAGASSTPPPPNGGPGATPRPAASTATIAIGDRIFRPASVTIGAGGSVTFRNDDGRDHTATGRSGAFDTGTLGPGETARRSFPTAGSFPFLCLLHPDMTGTVTVTGADGAPAPTARPATPAPTPGPAGPTPDPTGLDAAARILDFAFEPGELRVQAGATITWTNVGIAPHTVTATDGSFESGQLAAGQSYRATFVTPGRFGYLCAIHPSMTGVVVVRPAAGGGPGSSAGPLPSPSASPSAPSPRTPGSSPGTSPPGAEAGQGPGDPGGAGGVQGRRNDAGEPVGAGREIGSLLLVVALIGGMVLLAGTVIGGLRSRRDTLPLGHEGLRPGR